jgi:hypothetical protein
VILVPLPRLLLTYVAVDQPLYVLVTMYLCENGVDLRAVLQIFGATRSLSRSHSRSSGPQPSSCSLELEARSS